MPIPLASNTYYHLYNRANGDEMLFRASENYHFFLEKYKKHIMPICDTLCYCLMPNHFHFIVKIKNEETIKTLDIYNDAKNIGFFLSKQFSNLFSAYTQAYNKFYLRKGNLFMRPFKRKPIKDDIYLVNLILYIHLNPVAAGLCTVPLEWEYSSFRALQSEKETFLDRTLVLSYFDGIENFVDAHSKSKKL